MAFTQISTFNYTKIPLSIKKITLITSSKMARYALQYLHISSFVFQREIQMSAVKKIT